MDNINPLEEDLLELLRGCTVKIVVPGGHGTGFFVAPGLILTCAHVVEAVQKGTGSVTVYWEAQSFIASLQNFLSELHPRLKLQYPDLALLKVDTLVNANHPCVYLHTEAFLDDKMYSYGYTDEYSTGDPSTFINEGWTDEEHLLLKFKEGQARSGMSGAAVLNRRTGGVCGIMKRSRGTETDLGGRAIPTHVVFEKFPELVIKHQEFHQHDRRWYDCINQQQRKILGLLPPSKGIEVFFLYADVKEDEKLVDKLERHLAVMQKQKLITTWNKGKVMTPGDDEKSQMNAYIERAKIILLMVSSDFMALHYLDGTEVEQAMSRRNAGAIIIPILLRPADYQGAPFDGLMPLPTNRKPITEWSNVDSALLDITKGIRKVVEGLKSASGNGLLLPDAPFMEWARFYITTAKTATKTAQDLLTANGDVRLIEYTNQAAILDQQKKSFEEFRKLIDTTQQLPSEITLDKEELRVKVNRGIAQIEDLKTCIHSAPCQDIKDKFKTLSSTLDDLVRYCKIET